MRHQRLSLVKEGGLRFMVLVQSARLGKGLLYLVGRVVGRTHATLVLRSLNIDIFALEEYSHGAFQCLWATRVYTKLTRRWCKSFGGSFID
jgi:hypothetical protein